MYIRGNESEPGAGLLQRDVVDWYLEQQEEISNLDDLAAERKLVRQIIQRLITPDKILEKVRTAARISNRTHAPLNFASLLGET